MKMACRLKVTEGLSSCRCAVLLPLLFTACASPHPAEIMIWTILGVSVGVVAIFCVAVAELFVGMPVFEQHRPHIAIVLSLLGATAWFFGRHIAKRRVPTADEGAGHKTFALFDLRYWGPMLVVFGAITIFIQTLRPLPQVVVQARSAPPAAIPPPAPKLPPPHTNPPVVFPPLKLQGVILHVDSSVVIIGGRSYGVGDQVNGVVVKEINREGAIVEKGGETRTLSLK
jgi:hypothetical protein